MELLQKKEYKKVEKLLEKDNAHYPLMKSIISKNVKGKIYVDNREDIKSSLLMNSSGWMYLIGSIDASDIENEIDEFLQSAIDKNEHVIWFGISESWKSKVLDDVNLKIILAPRYKFEFNRSLYEALASIRPKLKPVKIDDAIIKDSEAVKKSILNFWRNEDEFLKRGFGFVMLNKDTVACQVISASIEDGLAEIDILTDENYRGLGLGYTASRVFIDECISRDIEPKWDCLVSNRASVNLAEKLGFEIKEEYQVALIKKPD